MGGQEKQPRAKKPNWVEVVTLGVALVVFLWQIIVYFDADRPSQKSLDELHKISKKTQETTAKLQEVSKKNEEEALARAKEQLLEIKGQILEQKNLVRKSGYEFEEPATVTLNGKKMHHLTLIVEVTNRGRAPIFLGKTEIYRASWGGITNEDDVAAAQPDAAPESAESNSPIFVLTSQRHSMRTIADSTSADVNQPSAGSDKPKDELIYVDMYGENEWTEPQLVCVHDPKERNKGALLQGQTRVRQFEFFIRYDEGDDEGNDCDESTQLLKFEAKVHPDPDRDKAQTWSVQTWTGLYGRGELRGEFNPPLPPDG